MPNALRFAPKKFYTYDTVFSFGQYAGQTVRDVLYDDPEYIVWAYKNWQGIDWDTQVIDDAWEQANFNLRDDYHPESHYRDWD